MLKAPKFWYKKNDTYLSNSLYPLSLLFRFGTKIRNFVSRKTSSGIPVICWKYSGGRSWKNQLL